MDQRKILATFLRSLAEAIEHGSASDLESLLEGQMGLTISGELFKSSSRHPRVRAFPSSKKDTESSRTKLSDLMDRLRRLESRDEGLDLLKTAQLAKKELEQLARLMDLPVSRDDDAERIRQRIIAASIGARLNSRAIRGEW